MLSSNPVAELADPSAPAELERPCPACGGPGPVGELPPEVLERHREQCYTIPLLSGKVRSLNLATSVGIVVYEGLRQLHGW